jgi:glycosyltransferase involved in cell wall biosynthesis
MRRILFISHAVEFAGAEIALLRFITLLDRTRFEPLLLLPRHGDLDALVGDIPVERVYFEPVLDTDWNQRDILQQIQPIRAVIEHHQPDLVVVNTNTLPQAMIATLMTDIPLMVHLHAFIVKEQFGAHPSSARFSDELWLSFVNHIIACSEWVAERYRALLNREITVVSNTTFSSSIAPYPAHEIPLIVMLASLEDNKRPEMFIHAAAGLRRKYPQLKFQCRLYGDGSQSYKLSLEALIEYHGLKTIFSLHPRVANTSSIYQACAIVFMPSAFEAFSLITLEAAAYQRPVVATRCGGPESIIIDGETGLLIDVDDVDAAIQKFAYLLQHPIKAAEIGKKAYDRYLSEYAPDIVQQQYQNAIEMSIQKAHFHSERRQWAKPIAEYFMNLPSQT